jgi:ribosome-binding protein aMBF1 (putative translation factor)
MNCPICGAEARNSTPADYDGLVVECRDCGVYEVPDVVLNALIRLDFAAREAALKRAKEAESVEARPSISRECL